MKILYISLGCEIDYQTDCLLIGLKELFGDSVVDVNKAKQLYETFNPRNLLNYHGKGFTVGRVLPDLKVDRTDIESKIRKRYFDLIVYGSVWRLPVDNYLNLVMECYPKNRICFIDGEDEDYRLIDSISYGVPYFKRELSDKFNHIFPISFALPTKHINISQDKVRDHSYITPLDRSTYVYKTEEPYFEDYRISRFGITMKKGGWDCMRHYEIMGQGCIPNFVDIDLCPRNTLANFPKEICSQVLKDLQQETPERVYDKWIMSLMDHFIKHNTTTALAKYVIDTMSSL
jgi:hypothetical protein